MIKPTIGRKVWYFSAPGTPEQDATVIDVHGDRCVSLFVVNRGGTTSTPRSVQLVQEGDEIPQGAHATWMPFQVGQAKAAAATAGDINPTGGAKQHTTEVEIAAVSTAPRVTPADLEAVIARECYFMAADAFRAPHLMAIAGDIPDPALNRITICVLVLRNGYTSVGINEGPVSTANFDPTIGRKYAREKALDKLWPLLGYQLKEQLYQRTQPAQTPTA